MAALSEIKNKYRASLALLFDRGYFNDDIITFQRATTATRVNQFGQIEEVAVDQPRLDYDPATGELKGLLIEEGRTNLIPNSNTSDFSINNATRGSSFNLGEISGFFYTSSGAPNAFKSVTEASGTRYYSSSVYVSQGTSTYAKVELIVDANSSRGGSIQFNFSTKTFTNEFTNATYISDFRYSYEAYKDGYIIYLTGELTVSSTVSCNVAWESSTSINIAGAQLEAGPFPTSYIPTAGSAVTRAADNCYIDGQAFTDFYNQSEGTILCEYGISLNDVFVDGRYGYQISDGTNNNRIADLINNPSLSSLDRTGVVTLSGSSVTVNEGSNTSIGSRKSIIRYQKGSFDYYLDGTDIGNGVTNIPSSLSQINLGIRLTDKFLNGHLKRLLYFPVALPDSELELLTSL